MEREVERGFTEAQGRVGGWVLDVLIILQVMVSQAYQTYHIIQFRYVQLCVSHTQIKEDTQKKKRERFVGPHICRVNVRRRS